MYYPTKKPRRNLPSKPRKNYPQNIQNSGLGFGVVNGLFKESKTSNYSLRDGRVHCQSTERTAVLTDVHGNRVVLKEHQTTFNTDKDGPEISYRDDGRQFRKRRRN